MSATTRDLLKPEFKDGERPSGKDFEDLIDSCVNKVTDGLSFDTDGNMKLTRGVQLGDSAGTVAGGLRFNSNQLQVFTGGAWTNVSGGGGGGGAFQPTLPTSPSAPVAYDGRVGIGDFSAAPTFKLEVPLNANTSTAEQVRFGNVVCANGSGTSVGAAVFSHRNHASPTNFALRQGANGAVQINSAAAQPISVSVGGTVRFGLSANGNVIVNGDTDLAGAGTARLHVNGGAFKNDGNADWAFTSDARVKEDIRDLELGLSELRQVRTVRYRYNGLGGTSAGLAGVGVLGQEIETVFPETIRRVASSETTEPGLDDLRVFDPSMLRYVLINAVKELAARVEQLEQALAAVTAPGAVPAIK